MNDGRHLSAMVVLADGRVLVSGGAKEGYEPIATAEIYSSSTDTWAPTGPMARPRFGHALVLLPDKTVLALGGGPGDAEVFDPTTGTWSDLSGAGGRSGAVVGVLPDGTVAVVGGRSDTVESWGVLPQPTNQFDRLDPTSRSWRRGPALDSVRDGASGAIAPDGSILVVGGAYHVPPRIRVSFWDPVSGATKASRDMLLWRPGATAWTRVPWPRSAGGRGASAVSLGAHDLLVLAGSGDGFASRHVAVVDTRTGSLRRASPMHVARHYAVPIDLGNGCVMVLGGAGARDPAEVFSWADDAWTPMPGPPLETFVAALLPDGSVMTLGDREHPRLVYRYRPVP